jgi:thiamine biosynthesis lipoprotein
MKVSQALCPVLCWYWLLLPLLTQSQPKPDSLLRYEYSNRQMGTLFRIVLYAPDSSLARQAANEAFRRVDTLNAILSDYLPNSELNRLSASAGTGKVLPVSPDLWKVLFISRQASRKSRGAFDVTVGPLVGLWRRSLRQQALPSAEVLAKARQSVDYRYLRLNRQKRTAELKLPGMRLDLGGIGKGYAVDEALAVLEQYGIRSALVDGGGNIVVSNAPPGRPGWQIELRTRQPDSIQTFCLTHASVSTSGDLYQYLELGGQRYSHILDPHTGLGLTNQSLVTVVAPNGMMADWLSTAVSVLGHQKGMGLAEQMPGVRVLIEQQAGGNTETWKSKRWVKSESK